MSADPYQGPVRQVHLYIYADLNDFLSLDRQYILLSQRIEGHPSVKHMLEAIGIPHPEVDLILVNGESVGFSYRVRPADRVAVFPMFRSINIATISQVRPPPLNEPRFILDNHLGKLAAYLRMLGFDTLYENDYQDDKLAQLSSRQDRILLTMDRGLLMRNAVTHGRCVRARNPHRQLIEVLWHFNLLGSLKPFSRCMRCNGVLRCVPKEEVKDRLKSRTQSYYDEFFICQGCEQIYWKGSHYQRMQRFIETVQNALETGGIE